MAKKEINLVLDTMEKPNRSIGTFKELDDIVFNFQIIENGKPKNLTSQEIRLYIAKPDKTVIQQTEQIQITSAIEGKVKIDLLNLATKVPGLNMGEISISDEEGRINTASFCYNVVSTIINDEVIESTNVIGVVKELEDILKKFKGDLEDFDQYQEKVKSEEEERKSSESQRKANEQSRESSEETRKASESSRVEAENVRVEAENSRVEVENSRVQAEDSRVQAESSRVQIEQSRVEAESGRVTAEEARALAEKTREERFDERFDEIKGEPGRDGVNGKSAYQVAQENGFGGTETEWLESLKGEKGEKGEGVKADDKTISKNNVWSSEKVAKEIFDNTSIWKPINGESVTITGARDNGYVRRFELEGLTLKNIAPDPINFNGWGKARGNITYTAPKNARIEYVRGQTDALLETNLAYKYDTCYTILFEYKAGGTNLKNLVVSRNSTTLNTIQTMSANSGFERVKVAFKTSRQGEGLYFDAGIRIYVVPKSTSQTDAWAEIKNIILLEGDYSNNNIPEWVGDEAISVGDLQGNGKYKIDIVGKDGDQQPIATKTILLPQQLKQGDAFKWSKEKDKYIIASKGQEVDTEIQEEIFIKTDIRPTMYLESSNALKPTIKGEYPIDGIKTLREENARLEETITGIYRMLNVQTLEETEHIEQDIMTTEEL